MLPEEFKEKTGIVGETAYLAANAIYMADYNGEKWLNNSNYCDALVRSPKMLIELINKMGEISKVNDDALRGRYTKRINELASELRDEQYKVANLQNILLNVKNLSEQIIKLV